MTSFLVLFIPNIWLEHIFLLLPPPHFIDVEAEAPSVGLICYLGEVQNTDTQLITLCFANALERGTFLLEQFTERADLELQFVFMHLHSYLYASCQHRPKREPVTFAERCLHGSCKEKKETLQERKFYKCVGSQGLT